MDNFVSFVRTRKIKMTLIQDYAIGSEFDPKAMVKRSLVGFSLIEGQLSMNEAIKRNLGMREVISNVALKYGAEVIDPISYLCKSMICPTRDLDGHPYYKDDSHFTPRSSIKFLTFISPLITEHQ